VITTGESAKLITKSAFVEGAHKMTPPVINENTM
jgi:hypothetical protein